MGNVPAPREAELFGLWLARIRYSRALSRVQLLFRLHHLMYESSDERLQSYADTITEAWLKRLENGEVSKLPSWIIEPLFQVLNCDESERRSLAEILVPDVLKPYLVQKAQARLTGPYVRKPAGRGRPKTSRLTNRQIQILQLAATGRVSREVADQLVVSKGTVDTHWRRILKELGAASREDALKIAFN